MSPSSLQAGVLALAAQIVALVVGFGILNSAQAGVAVSATIAAVNVAFLIAHSIHANAKPAKPKPVAKPIVKS